MGWNIGYGSLFVSEWMNKWMNVTATFNLQPGLSFSAMRKVFKFISHNSEIKSKKLQDVNSELREKYI